MRVCEQPWAPRTISVTLIAALLFANVACFSTQKVPVPASEPPSPYIAEPIYGVTTQSGDDVTFDEPGEVRVRGVAVADATVRRSSDAGVAVVHGTVAGDPYEIPLSSVASVWLERHRFNEGRTLAIFGGVAAFIAVVIAVMATADY